jgi:hypothetical protein
VNSIKKESSKKFRRGSVHSKVYGIGRLVWLSLSLLICNSPNLARQNPTTKERRVAYQAFLQPEHPLVSKCPIRSYIPNAAPLTPKQKFELAGKTIDFRGYGQGAQGYAKRYGAAYADTATSTLIGSAILP